MLFALKLWTFFTGSFIGRALGAALVASLVLSSTYVKGRSDGKAAYAEKVKAEISDAVQRGQQGRADALQELQNKGVPDGWFRD